jgi:hypothetical protein
MASIPHSRWLALLAAGGCLALAGPPADAAAAPGHGAKPKLTKKQRAKLRKQLHAEMQRNPAVVFNKKFLKRADLSDFKLPLTVRLSKPDGQGGFLPSDDQLEISYDDSANPWPLASSAIPAPQTTLLDGEFTMEASFGSDASGYGELGALETFDGNQIVMSATPFTMADFDPFCASGPELAADPANPIVVSSAGGRYGVMNMFSDEFRGSLSLRMTFASQVTDSCGGTSTVTPVVDNTNAPPMPVRMDGKFYVSPSITSDGKLRFGKIVIDDSVTPQTSTFGYVRACTAVAICSPEQFPARLKIKYLTADVLLGDIRS